ncbi:MAG: hypothetical protein MJ252_11975 [archaeon]|nr:hypothetical protein [archaeon]
MMKNIFHKMNSQGGTKYFQNSRSTEVTELQDELNSMKIDKQKDAMKQIIASMTTGKDLSVLFPQVVKCIRTKNMELKKLVYLYLINYCKIKPELTFLAVASFSTDANQGETPLIRGLAIRTMGCIRVKEVAPYLCETLINCFKDADAYVRKAACLCVPKLYQTNSRLVKENGFIDTLHDMLRDANAMVIANAMTALNEISVLSGVNQFNIKSKTLKKILQVLPEANEWGQVSILDGLVCYNPKKSSIAEEIIEAVLPRLSHANPSVVLSAIKVILKFLDQIESIDKVRNDCKKISNSLMSVMMAWPEVQYVLLRGLNAVILKRPVLLDKDFKFFFVQYNDPIYVKLEKVDILYRLCDNKNFDSIIKEFTSYALTELNPELIHKSIKHIGYIGYKYEKSLDLCVDSLNKILDNNNEEALNEGIIVARDLMRKYKGRALELLKKINIDFIHSLTDSDAKSAAFFIVGEYCTLINNSTEIISTFVDNFSNPEIVSKIKLQILNAAVKNFVNKPEEGEEIVKLCLQKGAEESDNPDVRDRAYFYWRLLETDPDIAKDMMISEKPPFDFTDDNNSLDSETIDDLIENMTNASAIYLVKQKELLLEEDMIPFEEEEGEKKEEPKEEEGEKEEKEKKKKKKKKKEEENLDADLMGIEEEGEHGENPPVMESPSNSQPATNSLDDIFGIFSAPTNNPQNNPMPSTVSPLDIFSTQTKIFEDTSHYPTSNECQVYSSPNLTIKGQFQRQNSNIILGLYFQSSSPMSGTQCQVMLNKNSFGLFITPNQNTQMIGNSSIVYYQVIIDKSNNDMHPPSSPFAVDIGINAGGNNVTGKIECSINVLLLDGFKLSGQPFVEFFQKNKDQSFNQNNFSYNIQSEDQFKSTLEKNNIAFSAKQNKANPPLMYFSANIAGGIPFLIEAYIKDGKAGGRVLANHESIVPLVKIVLDKIFG